MKALLSALAITTLAMTGCVAGPYDASYSYQSYQPTQRSMYYSSNRPYVGQDCGRTDCGRTVVVGPQYYKGTDYGCDNVQYKNYSNAPLVIRRPGASTMIIPNSWD